MKDNISTSQKRKNDHIHICKTQDVESRGDFDWADILLEPVALPEFDFDDVNTSQTFLGTDFTMPLFITGMTGGVDNGQSINLVLAQLAEKYRIPMGLGSQKIMLLNSNDATFFDLKKYHPDLFLIGNLGAVTLNNGVDPHTIVEKLIKPLQGNAFALHINALQECIQPEGERNFSNLLTKIEALVKSSPVPIIVKEVGSGISQHTCRQLINAGVAAIDVGGRGGTSWSVIEGLRQTGRTQRLGELFRNWGLTTKESLEQCLEIKSELNSTVEITATGGIRNGIHVAKCLALGATMCGIGLPFFRAVVSPRDHMTPFECLEEEFLFFRDSLRISMFCAGAKQIENLSFRRLDPVVKPQGETR